MYEIKVLHMYPDMLNLYGDNGNMEVLKYRSSRRGINFKIDKYSLGDVLPDLEQYDLIYFGGGADTEQQILSDDLVKYKRQMKAAHDAGVFMLLICGGYQLMGQYYLDSNGNKTPCLEVFDYYTQSSQNKRERCIGNIVINAKIAGHETEVIGFENHGGQTHGVKNPFGTVLYGNGNKFKDEFEGYTEKNVIATYLHGPLLSKNPLVADYIIKYCIDRKFGGDTILGRIDDSLEEKCREIMLDRLLKE